MRSISLAKRVLRDRRGNAAVEFALIAFPFFLLLFAILEVTFMFFLTTTLENAAVEASRKIRTGEIQNSGGTAQTFRDEVCAGVAVLVTCSGSNTYVDVRTYTDFNAITTPNPVTDGDFDPSGLTADFGVAGDIVVARVYFLWDVIMPDLGTGLSNLNGGKRLITATAAFRNEPFGTVSSSTATSSGSSTGSSSGTSSGSSTTTGTSSGSTTTTTTSSSSGSTTTTTTSSGSSSSTTTTTTTTSTTGG